MSSRSTHSATSSAVLVPATMSGKTEGSSSGGSAALPLPRRSHSSMRACRAAHAGAPNYGSGDGKMLCQLDALSVWGMSESSNRKALTCMAVYVRSAGCAVS